MCVVDNLEREIVKSVLDESKCLTEMAWKLGKTPEAQSRDSKCPLGLFRILVKKELLPCFPQLSS